MKTMLSVSLLLALCSALVWAETPLGDVARQQRASVKHATKVYTNDNLPTSGEATTVVSPEDTEKGAESAPATPGEKPAKPGAAAARAKTAKTKESESEDSPKELREKFLARYAQQKKSIDKLSHDLADLQQDYDKQTTEYWVDAGSQLRNQQQWAEKRRKLEEDIDTKQLRLQIANEELDEIKEQARRSGLPLTMFDEQ